MSSNGFALIPATEDVSYSPLPDTLTAPPAVGPLASDGGIDNGNFFLAPTAPTGVNTAIDSSGDEGYVDSAGALGGGNSTSSNNPNETAPAPGSPVHSPVTTSGNSWLEDLTKIAASGAQAAVAIEGPSRISQTGRYGQSAPVLGSKPSFWQTLLGSASGNTSGTSTSAAGKTGVVTIAFIGAVVLGLGFLVWKAVANGGTS